MSGSASVRTRRTPSQVQSIEMQRKRWIGTKRLIIRSGNRREIRKTGEWQSGHPARSTGWLFRSS